MGMRKVSLSSGAFRRALVYRPARRRRLALIVAELEDRPVIVLDEWAADRILISGESLRDCCRR